MKESYQFYIDIREHESVHENDVVHTTTSEFSFNSLSGCFDEQATRRVLIRAEHISSDYSEFDPRFSRTGGCYGYDTYRILEVLS